MLRSCYRHRRVIGILCAASTGFYLLILGLALAYPNTEAAVDVRSLYSLLRREPESISVSKFGHEQCRFEPRVAAVLGPIYSRLEADLRKYSNLTAKRKQALLDNCKKTSGVCQAVSLRNGNMYVVQLGAGFETRHSDVLQLIKRVVDKFYPLPDVDFVVDTGDGGPDTDQLPRFMMCGHIQAPQGIMVPDFTFYDYPTTSCPGEPGHKFSSFIHNASQRLQEMEADPVGVVNRRDHNIFWRGSRLNNPTRINQMEAILESIPPVGFDNKTYDISSMAWVANRGEGQNLANGCVSMHDHCKNRFLLHLQGNTYSSRLKYLLMCGSIVLMPEQEYEEWWSPAVPSKESVTLDNQVIAHVKKDVSDFHDVLGSFITPPGQPARANTVDTSLRAMRFAADVFSELNVDCYWAAVIIGAAKAWGPILTQNRGRPIDYVMAHPMEEFSDL